MRTVADAARRRPQPKRLGLVVATAQQIASRCAANASVGSRVLQRAAVRGLAGGVEELGQAQVRQLGGDRSDAAGRIDLGCAVCDAARALR